MRKIRDGAAALWLGHYSDPLLWTAIAVSIGDYATRERYWPVLAAAVVVWAVAVTAQVADVRRHREALCERCIAVVPLDPQAAVARWKGVLRAHHARVAMVAMMATVVAWDGAFAAFRHPPWWAYAVAVLAAVALGVSTLVTWQHRRLYPWCPFCHWDDGGDHEPSPDVPAPSVTR
jgi:hypothetical protein